MTKNKLIKDIYTIDNLKNILKLKDNNVYKVGKFVIYNGKIRKDESINQTYNFNGNTLPIKFLKDYINDSYNLKCYMLDKDNDIYNIKNI